MLLSDLRGNGSLPPRPPPSLRILNAVVPPCNVFLGNSNLELIFSLGPLFIIIFQVFFNVVSFFICTNDNNFDMRYLHKKFVSVVYAEIAGKNGRL